MWILTEFVLRMSFGLALGMALTSPRQVTSGYYRNHLYVLLGLDALATMVALSNRGELALAPPLLAAIASYLGAVVWLYERPCAGTAALAVVAAASLWGAIVDGGWHGASLAGVFDVLNPLTGGLVLGLTMAAMFLGHWYLNTPTMAIRPLEKLVMGMAAAICLRACVEGAAFGIVVAQSGWPHGSQWAFIALRWLAGIFGALALAVMTLKTLQIPNTQSATGILYVAVIATYLGELMALLLGASGSFAVLTATARG